MKLKQAVKYSWIATLCSLGLMAIGGWGTFIFESLALLYLNWLGQILFKIGFVVSIILSIVKWAKERKNAK